MDSVVRGDLAAKREAGALKLKQVESLFEAGQFDQASALAETIEDPGAQDQGPEHHGQGTTSDFWKQARANSRPYESLLIQMDRLEERAQQSNNPELIGAVTTSGTASPSTASSGPPSPVSIRHRDLIAQDVAQ